MVALVRWACFPPDRRSSWVSGCPPGRVGGRVGDSFGRARTRTNPFQRTPERSQSVPERSEEAAATDASS
eukprot:5334546-Pyramimonas_sp.AAC.1